MNSTTSTTPVRRHAWDKMRERFGAYAVMSAVCLAGVGEPLLAQTTVGVLNPNPNSLVMVDSPENVGHANFITQSAMSALVSSAFANNTGGVINWDSSNGWTANAQNAVSHTVSFGLGQSEFLTITRDDGGITFGPTTGSGSVSTSGDNYMGYQTTGSPFTLSFDTGLTAWGISQLNRFSSRTVTFSFTLADNSVITYNPQTQDPLGNNTGDLNWYGFQASANNPLVKVTMTANGFVRFDDMAFVVVPEPGVAALAALGLVFTAISMRGRKH